MATVDGRPVRGQAMKCGESCGECTELCAPPRGDTWDLGSTLLNVSNRAGGSSRPLHVFDIILHVNIVFKGLRPLRYYPAVSTGLAIDDVAVV